MNPLNAGRKLKVHMTSRRRLERLLNALGTFNLRHVSKEKTTNQKIIEKSPSFSGIFPFTSYIEHLGDGKMVHNRVLLIPRIYFLYKGKLSSIFFFRISTWFSDNNFKYRMNKKRVLSIQSHVVYGYVGNKAATFPLQVCTCFWYTDFEASTNIYNAPNTLTQQWLA